MRKKEEFGICHICGTHSKLSYEHIPPRSTFNATRRTLSSVDELLKSPSCGNLPPWNRSGLKYQQFQSGVRFRTLCKSCNSFTGGKYGTEYSKVVQGIGYNILKIPKQERKGMLTFNIQNVNILAFFKQIISMFCSVNTHQFGVQFREYLLNENSIDFDSSQYRVFVYLHSGKAVRYVPIQGQLNIKTGKASLFSEISTFPLGFILYVSSERNAADYYGCDITSFSTASDLRDAQISIPFLPTNTPFGLDFRDL